MSKPTGFDIQDFLSPLKPAAGGVNMEPSVDQMTDRLRELQLAKQTMEEEVKESQSTLDSLQEELHTLQAEAHQLDGILKDKEESYKVLQYQCDEAEQESARLLQQNKSTEELLQQYRCQIQGFKLKHRKQQLKFETQLQQLMEQHKNLHSVFTPQNLPAELHSAVNSRDQLLAAEKMKRAQLDLLEKELEMACRQRSSAEVQEMTQDQNTSPQVQEMTQSQNTSPEVQETMESQQKVPPEVQEMVGDQDSPPESEEMLETQSGEADQPELNSFS